MHLKELIILGRFVFVLSLILFLAGCEKTEENKDPVADYIFRGIVKSDKTGETLQGINVTIKEFGNKSVLTGESGNWYFEYFNVAMTNSWNFSLEDTDSIVNGSFETKDTTISINPGFLHDDEGNFYKGKVESEIVFTMTSK
jgi:putative lipoprotein (rSAM/lipoprotein system)